MDTTEPIAAPAEAPTSPRQFLAADLRVLVRDANRVLSDAAGVYDAESSRLRRRLAEIEAGAQVRLRAAAQTTDDVVHAHPYAALGLAATFGLLVGLLISRR